MKIGYCTIITRNYSPFAMTLSASLRKFDAGSDFLVLIVDENHVEENSEFEHHTISQLQEDYPEDFEKISRYVTDIGEAFRWALKPLFLKYLLEKKGYEKIIYVDPDIYFFNDPSFLFNLLDDKNVLITPHWRSRDPSRDRANFDLLFTGGIYNAGFFACTNKSFPILNWWMSACSYKMIKGNGFYVDQAYLNLIPVYFPDEVGVLDHKGCNVAGWNLIECPRTFRNGEVFIDGKFPIVFVHFTPGTIEEILSGGDPLLKPYLKEYQNILLESGGESLARPPIDSNDSIFFRLFRKKQ